MENDTEVVETETAPNTEGAPAETVDAAPADPTPDSFEWDKWDGKHEVLPENVRGWAAKLQSHYTKDVEDTKAEVERIRVVYEQLIDGKADPRVAELQRQLEDGSKSAGQVQKQLEEFQAQHEAYRKEVEAWVESQQQAKVEAFKAQHPWIFSDEEITNQAAELLNEDFLAEQLPELLRMPPKLLEAVRKAQKDLAASGAKNPGAHAIKIARAEFQAPTGSPAARRVAGANGSTPTTAAPLRASDSMSLEAQKDIAFDRALRVIK